MQSRAQDRGTEHRGTLHIAGSGVCIPGGKALSLSQTWREGGSAGQPAGGEPGSLGFSLILILTSSLSF